jgi:hypothetical protein
MLNGLTISYIIPIFDEKKELVKINDGPNSAIKIAGQAGRTEYEHDPALGSTLYDNSVFLLD